MFVILKTLEKKLQWGNYCLSKFLRNWCYSKYGIRFPSLQLTTITNMRTTLFTALLVLCIVWSKGADAQIFISQDITCNGSASGELLVVPNFGTGPYTYLWSTGAITPSVTNLVAGLYSVTVTDVLLATTIYSETLTDPPPLSIAFVSQTNVLCNGFSTGAIDVTVAGGTGSYWYNWSNGAITEDISNVPAGNYTLIATDANGCTATNNYIITQPASAVSVTIASTNVTCFGGGVIC